MRSHPFARGAVPEVTMAQGTGGVVVERESQRARAPRISVASAP